ncbi:hypothetical protein TWF730_011229 [Orbilia blumenaviensis]|uniref:Telomeric repeat-binding factor 2-interacting protein 1 n=1 Tax=Orbilia blumenaviensis TaxID=1796055 RepID=A0AAV9UP87_9PEZI
MSDDGEDELPPERDRLFCGLSFFLTNLCPTKDYFRTLVETNGGKVCKTDRNADLIISDHLKSHGAVEKAVSYKWIDACVENRELVDIKDFYISALRSRSQLVSKKLPKKSASSIRTQIASVEPVGGYRPSGGRVLFTVQDDNILLWWLEKESKLSGNKTYQELALWCTRHGWQGWRERWVKKLSRESKYRGGPKPAPDFDITKVPGWKSGIRRPGDGASTSLPLTGDETESEDEGTIDMRPEHVAAVTANLEGLLNAETEDDLDDIFNKIADRFPERSVDEFKEFYYSQFLPRFEKANRAQAQTEVEDWEEDVPVAEEEDEHDSGDLDDEPRKFSIREQRSLFSQFDDIVWADSEEEQLEVCRSVADEFGLHSAEELLEYALNTMKPIIKKLKGKGKIHLQDLEQVVLRHLSNLAESPRKGLRSLPAKNVQSPQKQDTRFEKLGTPVQRNIQNQIARLSALSKATTTFSTPKKRSSPIKPVRKATQTPPSGQVLVYSPEIPVQLPQSSPISHSSFHTPSTSKADKVAPGSSVSVRRAPPSLQNSPGTPTPRPRTAVKPLSLLGDEPIPSEPSPGTDPLKKFTDSIQQHLNSARGHRKLPPSSPPGQVPSSVLRSLPSRAPANPPEPVYSSFSSEYDESEQIPYQKPMRARASSVPKQSGPSSSLPSTAKRRRIGSSARKEMVVESTPERKPFPLPVLDVSSSVGQSSPVVAQQQERGFSQTVSPLAYKTRKRKAEERYQEITPPLESQEIEAEGRRSDSGDTIEEHEEEATVIDAEFVMIKQEHLEDQYQGDVQRGVAGLEDGDMTEEEEEFDDAETQDGDDDLVEHARSEDHRIQADESDTEEEIEPEIKEEPLDDTSEADPMEMDSLTNRNLGILNDNSPIIAARQSVTPVIPDDSDDISDQAQTAPGSPSPSQLSVRAADFLINKITERMCRQYNLEEGAVGLVIYATSCNEDLMHIILKQLSEYQEENGTLSGFIWPTMRGIWTVEDDKAVDGGAPDYEVARIYEKHGEEMVLARWDWLSGIGEGTQASYIRSTPDLEGSVTPARSSPGLLAPSRENSVAPEGSDTPRGKTDDYEAEVTPTPRPRRR